MNTRNTNIGKLEVEALEDRQLTASLGGAMLVAPSLTIKTHLEMIDLKPLLAGKVIPHERSYDWSEGLRPNHNETFVHTPRRR